jgi:peptidoglycan-associated lipoprotein
MIKRHVLLAAVALALAGCGSNVKLDPPVQGDASATTGTEGAGAAGQGAGQSSVAQVQAGGAGADAAGPAGVGRVIYFDYDSFSVKADYQPWWTSMPASCRPTAAAT